MAWTAGPNRAARLADREPYLLTVPGVEAREITPWQKDAERWRRLAGTFGVDRDAQHAAPASGQGTP